MKILFIGGTGNISSECVSLLEGHEVWALTRGSSHIRRKPLPDWAHHITEKSSMKFDVVADFVCYTEEQARARADFFKGKCGQYIFISSTAVYSKPAVELPYKEDHPADNAYWSYAKNKRQAELAFLNSGMPVTIIRPGHTYNMIFPSCVGGSDWTIPARMLEGKPVYICDDRFTIWTLTHATDFAKAFVGLLGKGIGETYHITNDEWLSWKQIYWTIANALGVVPSIRFITTDRIKDPKLHDEIHGHKAWCDIYDNSKIKATGWKATTSFEDGINRTIDWYMGKEERRVVDDDMNKLLDNMEHYESD